LKSRKFKNRPLQQKEEKMLKLSQEVLEFREGTWNRKIDVRDFVTLNVSPYYGDDSFLAGATERTKELWQTCLAAMKEER